MDHEMGYFILLAILAIPAGLVCGIVLAIATGIIHEPTNAEAIAQSYGNSWKTLAN